MTESDIEPTASGGSSPDAPQGAKVESPTGPATAAANSPAGSPQPFGSFGSARGSGLARGKRASATAPSSASPASEYKPTAVEVIVPRREYKNPFEAEPPVAVDKSASWPSQGEVMVETPQKTAQEERPSVERTATLPTLATAEPPRREAPAASHSHPAPPLFPLQSPGPATGSAGDAIASDPAKSELNILPPAEAKKLQVHWENPVPQQKAPVYPPHPPRDERRERRPNFRYDSPGSGSTGRPAAPAALEPKPAGFMAWLKGLFGAKPSPAAVPDDRRPESEVGRDQSHHHRRRRRGGRGQHRSERGDYTGQSHSAASGEQHPYRGGDQPRDDRPGEGGSNGGRSGDQHGDGQGGHRRRHRGGRGRHRDERSGPRPEGHQGGGFI